MRPIDALRMRATNSSVIGAAFDSGTKGSGVTLSNSNFTATKSGTSKSGAKSLYGKKTAKWYFEVNLTTRVSGGGFGSCGLARIDQSYVAVSTFGLGVNVFTDGIIDGNLWVDGVNQAALGTPSSGDVYRFAIDLTNALIWVRRNSGSWNANGSADPATGVGGLSLGDLTGYALTPFVTLYNDLEALTLVTTAASLANAPPSGFTAGWPAASAQDNSGLGFTTFLSGKNVNIALSNGNLTATRSATDVIAKSRDPKSEGKQYIEFICNNLGGANDGVGLCDVDASYTNVGSGGTKCCFIFKSGNIWTGGGTGTALGAIANGDNIAVAVDWANLKFWMRKNGGNWNNSGTANPATNTGGITFSSLCMVPAATFGSTGSSGSNNVTLNAGATAFTYTVPSGFESGWDVEGNP